MPLKRAFLTLDIEGLADEAQKRADDQQKAQSDYDALSEKLEQAEARLSQLQEAQQSTAEEARLANNELSALNAQIDALSYLLHDQQTSNKPPISDSLTISSDMEAALAVFLSTDLSLAGKQMRLDIGDLTSQKSLYHRQRLARHSQHI